MTTPKLKALITAFLCIPALAIAQEAPSGSLSNPNEEKEEDVVVLSVFEVTADADEGYAATNAVSGTRLNTNLLELPKTVDVITAEFIKDIGAIDMQQALQYSSGVVFADDNPGMDDIYGGRFAIRGIQTSTSYRNGFPSSFIVDPVMIDRIEIIKGPSSTFSGPIEPGGTRNTITRKPPVNATTSISARHESYDRFRGQIVNGGPITADKSLRYRMAGVYENMDSHQNFANRKRYVAAGSLFWKMAPKTMLQADFQFIRSEVIPSGDVAYFRVFPQSGGVDQRVYQYNTPRSFNYNGPNAYANTDQYTSFLDFTHQFSSTWTLRLSLMHTYQIVDRHLPNAGTRIYFENTPFQTSARFVQRGGALYQPNSHSYVVNPHAYLAGSFKWGSVDHKLLVGTDFYFNRQRSDVYRRATSAQGVTPLPKLYIDWGDSPVNDYTLGNPLDYGINTGEYRVNDLRRVLNRNISASMNNIFQFFNRRLTLLQSVRYTHVDTIRKNLMDNSRDAATDDNWVQSYGASYKLTNDFAFFVSYSESFLPQTTYFTYDGNMIDPLEGKGWDLGFKYNFIKNKLSGTVALYDLEQKNAASRDPDHSTFYIASGTVDSRGVEVNIQATPIKNWQILLGYSYIDAEVTRAYNDLPERLGRVANVPKHQLTLWNHYRISNGIFKGLSAGFGVIYMSNRRTSATWWDQQGIEAAGYTRFNANLAYSTKFWGTPITFRFEVNNITNKRYFSAFNYYGMPRTYAGSIEIRF